jgi:hypothetical protein
VVPKLEPGVLYEPTAQTVAGSDGTALTPLKWLLPLGLGLGLATTLQRVPSQCSTRVRPARFASYREPTAHASFAPGASTSSRLWLPAKPGWACRTQAVPVQRSSTLRNVGGRGV